MPSAALRCLWTVTLGDQVMLDYHPLSLSSAVSQVLIHSLKLSVSQFSFIFYSHFFCTSLLLFWARTNSLGGVCCFSLFFVFLLFPLRYPPFSLILQMFGMTLAQVVGFLPSPLSPVSHLLPSSSSTPLISPFLPLFQSFHPSSLSLAYPLTFSPTSPLFSLLIYSQFSPSTFLPSLIQFD